jgi:hypothetical protein
VTVAVPQGAPEMSLDLRAPLPLSHPIPQVDGAQEPVCVLWLAWGGLNQGAETTKYGLRRAGRPPYIPPIPKGCPDKAPSMMPCPAFHGAFFWCRPLGVP